MKIAKNKDKKGILTILESIMGAVLSVKIIICRVTIENIKLIK